MTEIRIASDQRVVTATLDDTAAARSFAEMLPLTLDIEDFHRTEKIAYLSDRLDTSQAPEGVTPRAGDLAYYAPWGNIALFYRDFGYSTGLVHLGTVTSSTKAIEGLEGRVTITTE